MIGCYTMSKRDILFSSIRRTAGAARAAYGGEGGKMDPYVTGEMIRTLREKAGLTQTELAERISVSDKTVSKWECGRGYPDITLLPSLSAALHVTVQELLQGRSVTNTNLSGNIRKSSFRVCPVCGNILFALGDACISCCGIPLLPEEVTPADEEHPVVTEPVEDEICVTVRHEMTREHYISFIAAFTDDGVMLTKLYPEGEARARFRVSRLERIVFGCNRHGLYCVKYHRPRKEENGI